MTNNKKTIGIIGGMGPFASARLLELILDIAKRRFKAESGEDFPEIVLLSLPVKEFLSDRNLAKKALVLLLDRIKSLEKQKVSSFAIACNTAHIFSNQIQKSTKIEFVSIIEETVSKLKGANIKKVGLLASPVTISSKLYESRLKEEGIEVLLPSSKQIKKLGDIISELVSNGKTRKNRLLLIKIAESLKEKGAQTIVLGCTELPLVFPKRVELPVVDTLEILANALLERCYISN